MALAEQATNVLLLTGGAGGLALGAWVLRQAGMRDTGGLLHPGRWRAIAGSLAYMGFDVAAVAAAFAAFGSPPTFGPLLLRTSSVPVCLRFSACSHSRACAEPWRAPTPQPRCARHWQSRSRSCRSRVGRIDPYRWDAGKLVTQ